MCDVAGTSQKPISDATDYAMPRSKVAEAKARDAKFNSTEAVAELVERAKRSFKDLATTGEGGEMRLYLLADPCPWAAGCGEARRTTRPKASWLALTYATEKRKNGRSDGARLGSGTY